MGCCGSNEPKKKKVTYVCRACGKEELIEDAECCQPKSCCGQPMDKKE